MGSFRRHHATLDQQRLQAAIIQTRQLEQLALAEDRVQRIPARTEIPKPHIHPEGPRLEPVLKRRPR
jgi:hypothetical protein